MPRSGTPIAGAALVVLLMLTGCAPGESPNSTDAPRSTDTQPTDTRPTGTPRPVPSASPVPGGSAAENLPWFDAVNRELLEARPMPGGRAIVDGLIATGFDRDAIEVTPDRTPDGHAADAVQFSVRVGEECLLGQASGAGYSSVVAGVLATGTCLVGRTRPIDW